MEKTVPDSFFPLPLELAVLFIEASPVVVGCQRAAVPTSHSGTTIKAHEKRPTTIRLLGFAKEETGWKGRERANWGGRHAVTDNGGAAAVATLDLFGSECAKVPLPKGERMNEKNLRCARTE